MRCDSLDCHRENGDGKQDRNHQIGVKLDFIRLGDKTTGDGEVISASETAGYEGRKLARKGDRVTCKKHPQVNPNIIIEGDESMSDEGTPLARHLYRVTCGCQVISSLC